MKLATLLSVVFTLSIAQLHATTQNRAPIDSITGYFFYDIDHDNCFSTEDTLLAGQIIKLYNSSNGLIASVTTTESGKFSFGNLELELDEYHMRFDVPYGYELADFVSCTTLDPTILTVNSREVIIRFSETSNDTDIALGFRPQMMVASTIFVDTNDNGIQDVGEQSIADYGKTITMEVLDKEQNLIQSSTSDARGIAGFFNLPPGDYYLGFNPPSSYPVSSSITDDQDNGVDGNDNGIQGDTNDDNITDGYIISPLITLSHLEEPLNEYDSDGGSFPDENGDWTIDFGLIPCNYLKGEIFSDDNQNGCKDEDEDDASERIEIKVYHCDSITNKPKPLGEGDLISSFEEHRDWDDRLICITANKRVYLEYTIPNDLVISAIGNCDSITRFYPNENGQTGCVTGLELSENSFNLGLLFPSNTKENLDIDFTISPQPVIDQLTISYAKPLQSISLRRITGELLSSHLTLESPSQTILDLHDLDAGKYLVVLHFVSGKSFSKKVIKM